MKIRFSAGSEVLRIADILATEEALAPLSVEGALLVFDLADDQEAAIASIRLMDTHLAAAIADVDSANAISALTALKKTLLDVETDALREFAGRAVSAPQEAAVVETGSHPTGTGDAAISNVSTQSSVETNEEIDNEPSQPQQPQRRRRS